MISLFLVTLLLALLLILEESNKRIRRLEEVSASLSSRAFPVPVDDRLVGEDVLAVEYLFRSSVGRGREGETDFEDFREGRHDFGVLVGPDLDRVAANASAESGDELKANERTSS